MFYSFTPLPTTELIWLGVRIIKGYFGLNKGYFDPRMIQVPEGNEVNTQGRRAQAKLRQKSS